MGEIKRLAKFPPKTFNNLADKPSIQHRAMQNILSANFLCFD